MYKALNIGFNSETKKLIKDFVIVFFNNAVSFLSGVLTAFALPKILSMEDYSDYKLFLLYLSYIGLFHFGLVDGVVVKFAGKAEREIGLERYRFFTRLLFAMESIVAIIILMVVSVSFQGEYRFIGQVIAIDVIFHNFTSYFRSVLQITMKYKLYTATGIYGNLFQIVGVGVLCLLKSAGYVSAEIYIMIFMLGETTQAIICLLLCRDIVFGKTSKVNEISGTVSEVFKTGIPVLIAGIVATLILNLDRQFISLFFTKKEYAIYSFSYSLMNIILTLITAMSVVLYPAMKVKEKRALSGYYEKFTLMLSIFVFGCLAFMPLLNVFIQWFLPNYESSLEILRLIFPIVAALSIMQIVIINFYKVIENTRTYLMISIVALGISFALNCIGYYLFRSMEAIAAATVLSCFAWQYISDKILRKNIQAKGYEIKYSIFMCIIYYVSFLGLRNVNEAAGVCNYIIVYGICSFMIWKRMIKKGEKE